MTDCPSCPRSRDAPATTSSLLCQRSGADPRRARAAPSRRLLDRRQAGERHRELAFVVVAVLQLAGEVVHVRLHVEVAVAAEVEEDRARDAFLAAADRLVDRALHRVVRLRRGEDALDARTLHHGIEQRALLVPLRYYLTAV